MKKLISLIFCFLPLILFIMFALNYLPGYIYETIDDSVTHKLKDKKQLILIYCRSGNRSKQATTKLANLGYTNLIEFGGIIDWTGKIEK